MDFYIRCAVLSLASLVFLLSSSVMNGKSMPASAAAASEVPAATLTLAAKVSTN
ncbi:hypothetical protein [Uliginosibacterium flavum]|uniref:Uncharacterized protein n=1 Tax=Uliginosibacterium flavum TaxID=1396831 RepID=A0ABV2TPN6_9RHOO